MNATAQPQIDLRRLFVVSYLQVAKQQLAPQNRFEAFYPFIVSAAEPHTDKQFDSIETARRLREAFGWPVGADFVDLFTNDLIRRGLLRSVDQRGTVQHFWTTDAQDESSSEIDTEVNHLRDSFWRFSEDLAALFLHNMDAEGRLHQLAILIASNQLFSHDSLSEYAERATSTSKIVDSEDFEYVSAKFILWAKKADDRSFKALSILANLGVVTQLASFFHRRTDGVEKTGSPTIILDGPLLLDIAGFNGPDRHHDTQLLLELAHNRGCKVWIFRHSVYEAKDIVKAVLMSAPGERFGPLALALRNKQVSQDALQLFLDDPVGITERMGVCDRILDVNPDKFKTNSDSFTEEDWRSIYGALSGWKSDLARARDSDSVAGVMRLRDSHASKNPWDTRYLLLTSNVLLAQIVTTVCSQLDLTREDDIGPLIARSEFAALLWLSGDPANKREIVSSHLMAAAQGVLAQDRRLVERLKEYSANVSAERREFVDAVAQTELSYEMLQNVTLGDPRRVDDNAIQAVIDGLLDEGRREGAAETSRRHRESRRKLREDTHLAQAERDEAKSGEIAAKEEAQRIEVARAVANAEKTSALQRAAIELKRRKQIEDVLDGVIGSAENDVSRTYAFCRALSHWLFYILFFAVGCSASVIAYSLKGSSGVFTVFLVFGAGTLFSISEWAKASRGHFVDWLSAKLIRRRLEKGKRRLLRQLKIVSPAVIAEFSGTQIRFLNRAEILAAAQGEVTA